MHVYQKQQMFLFNILQNAFIKNIVQSGFYKFEQSSMLFQFYMKYLDTLFQPLDIHSAQPDNW